MRGSAQVPIEQVPFADRNDAGRRLAREICEAWGCDQLREELGANGVDRVGAVVLGLPRGGVPVAVQVAEYLGVPLDVMIVRKLGLPGRPEFAMGAIAEAGVEVIDDHVVRKMGVTSGALAAVREREREELEARAERYRKGRPRTDLHGRHAVLVDDGIATGATAAAACRAARALGAARVTIAVPVMPTELARDPGCTRRFGADVEVVAVRVLKNLGSVGQHYADFTPTTDAEVERLLHRLEV